MRPFIQLKKSLTPEELNRSISSLIGTSPSVISFSDGDTDYSHAQLATVMNHRLCRTFAYEEIRIAAEKEAAIKNRYQLVICQMIIKARFV